MGYDLGINRIYYKASGFQEGLIVTAILTEPNLNIKVDLTFNELEEGVYYCDHSFTQYGKYVLLLYEDGVKSQFQAITVTSHFSNEVHFII